MQGWVRQVINGGKGADDGFVSGNNNNNDNNKE